MLLEMVEVVRLAKEARDVGGQRGDHLLALADPLAAGDQRAVVAKALQPQRPQPLGEPRVDQRCLGFRQVDAGVGMQHGGDVLEVLAGQKELAGDQRLVLRTRAGRRSVHRGHAAPPGRGAMKLGAVGLPLSVMDPQPTAARGSRKLASEPDRATTASTSRIRATRPSPRMVAAATPGTRP